MAISFLIFKFSPPCRYDENLWVEALRNIVAIQPIFFKVTKRINPTQLWSIIFLIQKQPKNVYTMELEWYIDKTVDSFHSYMGNTITIVENNDKCRNHI
jgi:hypothetical protein